MDLLRPPASEPRERICSSRGCRASGVTALQWNNPRLHPPERRKTWLACDHHTGQLADFLSVRGFLRETVPIDQLPVDQVPIDQLPVDQLPS